MDKTIEQVKQLAHRYGVPKLVLFGSRARGDHHVRSDYDFAVWGCTAQQRAQFSDAVENDLDSLYSVDLVFVSEHTDAALLENIEKDGICLLDRYNTKFENLTNAVEQDMAMLLRISVILVCCIFGIVSNSQINRVSTAR